MIKLLRRSVGLLFCFFSSRLKNSRQSVGEESFSILSLHVFFMPFDIFCFDTSFF